MLAMDTLQNIVRSIDLYRKIVAMTPHNTDIKFNLAKALLLYADIVMAHACLSEHQDVIVPYTVEAMELLESCRVSQSSFFAGEDAPMDIDQDQIVDEIPNEPLVRAEGFETVSNDTFFDTLIALIECYTAILYQEDRCEISPNVTNWKGHVQNIVISEAQKYMTKCLDVAGAMSRFKVAEFELQLAEAEASPKRTEDDWTLWATYLQEAIKEMRLGEASSIQKLCAIADSAVSFADCYPDPATIWELLTVVNGQVLSEVCRMEPNKASVWVNRGNIELLRAGLDQDISRRNRGTLLQNAVVYYKRAAAEASPKDIRLKGEAMMKQALANAELLSQPIVKTDTTSEVEEMRQVIADAKADGLITAAWHSLPVI